MPKDKVIAYFSKYRANQSDNSDHQNGIPLVPKNHDDRKVLVDAGDRCVAPAKSRPKKRKTVKPLRLADKGADGSPLRPTLRGTPDVSESVLWSDQVYTVRHLVKQFDGQFPVIVRVDEGHYREGVVDLARGQVLLVSNHGKQKRVLARNNSTDTLLSLPVDYQMDITLPSCTEVVDFTTAVKERELPFTATVSSVSPLSNASQGNLTGEDLTFLSVKDTVFLRANSINHGWTDQSEILVIPELVQVQFSVAEGLQGATEQEWHDYQGMFARCVRHLSFNSITGFQGILLEGSDGNELLFASNSHLADTDSMTGESQALQEANERKKQRIAYENLRLSLADPWESPNSNLHPQAEDITSHYDNLPFNDSGQNAAHGNIDQINGRIDNAHAGVARADGGGSGLNRNPSELRVIRCSSSTLDYRRPKEDRPSDEQSLSGSTHSVPVEATNGFRRTCSDVSEANSEMIDQVFSEIVDLNKVDQTQVAAKYNNNGALEVWNNTAPVQDNFHKEMTHVNTSREEYSKKESSVGKTPVPTSKVNIFGFVTKFKSPSQSQADDVRPSGHLLQRPESKSEYKHADDHPKKPRPFGSEKPKPNLVQETKPGPVQMNRIQPPQTSQNPVRLRHQDTSTITSGSDGAASGIQEEFSGRPNRIPQKPAKPLLTLQEQTRTDCISSKPSSPNVTPSSLPMTSVATKPLPDSKPNRLSHLQSPSNRNTKPNPPVLSATPANQRSSVTRDFVIKSSADVPSELESLSVTSVTQCLELLHLDRHVADFNRNAIDGRKLTDLTEKVLEHQFHFTPLDASKLVRFIRGWRP